VVGARLIVIDVVGRTTGRHFRVPHAYTATLDQVNRSRVAMVCLQTACRK
jgi:hypothetical protein